MTSNLSVRGLCHTNENMFSIFWTNYLMHKIFFIKRETLEVWLSGKGD